MGIRMERRSMNYFKICFQICALASFFFPLLEGRGATVRVTEYNKDRVLLGTYDINTEPLVVGESGSKTLNIDEGSLVQSKAKQLLSSQFGFSGDCEHKEMDKFLDRNPRLHGRIWEIKDAFDDYVLKSGIKLESGESCFAEDLEQLISSHDLIKKKGLVEIRIMPVPVETKDFKYEPKVVGVVLRNWQENPKNTIAACRYQRNFSQETGGNFFVLSSWSALVDRCSKQFLENKDIRQMADAQVKHLRTR